MGERLQGIVKIQEVDCVWCLSGYNAAVAVETLNRKRNSLHEPSAKMVSGYTLATALRIYKHDIEGTLKAGEDWIQNEPIIEIFFQGAIGVGIRPDLNTGSMRVVSRVLTSGGYKEIIDPDRGFYYFNSRYVGVASTPENLAEFAGAAAREIEAHDLAIRRLKARGRAPLIH